MELGYFFDRLEQLYRLERPEEVETYMKQGIEEAVCAGDGRAVCAILNELMGFYRVHSRFGECILCIEQAMELAELLDLKGTVDYGTMLLNAATGYRAAGKYEEAERYYREAGDIYGHNLPPDDFRMASFHNNVSLLYIETGHPEAALRELEAAMEILHRLTGVDGEIATSHTNLGIALFKLGRITEGARHMEEAVEIFERSSEGRDSHYPASLAGLGEAHYHQGNLEKSAMFFEKALRVTLHMYGENKDCQVIRGNLAVVQRLLECQKAVQGISGMELSRQYYEHFGAPMLMERYPEYVDRIAAGLVGEGSECMGFDDKYSTDHDFGPGFCLWLTKEDYQMIGKRLQEDYSRLPRMYGGLEAKHLSPYGKERVGVFCMDDFFQKYTGHTQNPENEEEWMEIPQEGLCIVTNGEIFRDNLGIFSKRRDGFLNCPFRVRQKKLAAALGRMAQSGQYNVGRSRKRGDMGALYFSLSEFVNAAAEAAYLLNNRYQPFYKWRMHGMKDFKNIADMKEMLEKLMKMQLDDEAMDMEIEKICRRVVEELNRQGFSDRKDCFLEDQKKWILQKIGDDSCHGRE